MTPANSRCPNIYRHEITGQDTGSFQVFIAKVDTCQHTISFPISVTVLKNGKKCFTFSQLTLRKIKINLAFSCNLKAI